MFWIVLLVIVGGLVFLVVIGSRKAKEREAAEAVKKAEEAAKEAEELEKVLEEFRTKAKAGDAIAQKRYDYLTLKNDKPLCSASSRYIRFKGAQTNTVYSTAGNILLQVIAGSDGWDDFSIGSEYDDTKNRKEGHMQCRFKAPTGETCYVTWGYDKRFAERAHDYIRADVCLKTNSILTNSIVREFEEKMIGFLKSQGAVRVRTVIDADSVALDRIWDA
jgi:hypothetical protein